MEGASVSAMPGRRPSFCALGTIELLCEQQITDRDLELPLSTGYGVLWSLMDLAKGVVPELSAGTGWGEGWLQAHRHPG